MKPTITLVMLLCNILFIHAQSIEKQVVASAGEIQTNASYQLVSTIGEPIIGLKSNTVHINQGFLAGVTSTTLSIEEEISSSVIKLYPNPVIDALHIAIENNQNTVKASVYSMTGQLVLTRDIREDLQQIDVSHLSTGIYLVRLRNTINNTSKTFKISKK